MLLGYLDLLLSDPLEFLRVFPVVLVTTGVALLVAITVHEASHALASHLLGDSLARRLGRLTLNPIRHLDPAGTLLFLLVGFGWGKPVPVNPLALNGGRQGMAAVSAAGPLSNVATALLLSVLIRVGIVAWQPSLYYGGFLDFDPGYLLSLVVSLTILLNIVLAVFNLIPLFPLDGSGVALGLLPTRASHAYARLGRYGPAILFAVIALDAFTDLGILSSIIGPVVNYMTRIIVGLS